MILLKSQNQGSIPNPYKFTESNIMQRGMQSDKHKPLGRIAANEGLQHSRICLGPAAGHMADIYKSSKVHMHRLSPLIWQQPHHAPEPSTAFLEWEHTDFPRDNRQWLNTSVLITSGYHWH